MYTVSGTSTGLGRPTGSFDMIFARRGAFVHLTAPDSTTWWSAQVSAPHVRDPRTVEMDELLETFATGTGRC
ncbi:hypothetical protein ABZ816_33695 [Actinosynnema sp. NPDC047251]|uniref:Uncharacterized protein n=1 Tax=Saccharothrix espanaensis (strain ATCC 51144 / DSM 44229 / JCM 9112 / NBRC 15066 / NRRL 15764) TaxID=1179773 RepID=K0K437_SACES|nr:hypothetical protein [Saccharothrix espanaensis]CCH33071.1 hypothetical protein BN6_58130 [Saccharothrix espanaensis DSM 44229]